MVFELRTDERTASPANVDVDMVDSAAASSQAASHLDPPGAAQNGQKELGRDERKSSNHSQGDRQHKQKHHTSRNHNNHKSASKAQIALSDPKILDGVFRHLWDELIVHGREARQSYFRNLTVVAKSWVEPASQWLWMNPYFGTARRAALLEDCLHRAPDRGLHIRKLIFGEGSSTDIMDWVTKHNVPRLLRAAPNVQVVGMGGLQNVDLNETKDAFHSRPCLEEVRACDLLPEPWCYFDYLCDEVLGPCKNLSRLRLYNIYTEVEQAQPLKQRFSQIALNHCAIDSTGLKRLFASSSQSLHQLHMEYPMDLDEDGLISTLEHIGAGLRELTVQGFLLQGEQSEPPNLDNLVDRILEVCPKLVILNFPEAIGSLKVFEKMIGSKLELWSFSCKSEVRPEHWIQAFKSPGFPHPGNCRMYCSGWKTTDVRQVRIQAYSIGVNWLSSGETITELSEDFVN